MDGEYGLRLSWLRRLKLGFGKLPASLALAATTEPFATVALATPTLATTTIALAAAAEPFAAVALAAVALDATTEPFATVALATPTLATSSLQRFIL